jgi:hypothetical protein
VGTGFPVSKATEKPVRTKAADSSTGKLNRVINDVMRKSSFLLIGSIIEVEIL